MPPNWSLFLSDFADQGVILPLALVMALTLRLLGWRRGAIGWLIAVGGTLGAIVLAKLVFLTLPSLLPFRLVSPSAHAAAGALVYGSLLALLLRGGRAGPRTAFVTSTLFALGFGTTRLDLGVHSLAEVLVGAGLGIIGSISFVKIAGRMPHSVNRLRLAAASALVILLVYGNSLSGEHAVRAASGMVRTMIQTAIAQPRGD
jgi:membrane-associated phospholipid phosphatase